MTGKVLNTNVMAINAGNSMAKASKALNGSLEKLASGSKINRAADDASGLAISEKMKSQIKALDTASSNAEDGASMLQTAEGYLTEIHDIMNRMVELAEKSANGTNEDSGIQTGAAYGEATQGLATNSFNKMNAGTDRAAIQSEMDQLTAEVDRIALTANFNGNKLFNGNLSQGDSVAKADGSGFITGTSPTDTKSTGAALTLQIGETSVMSDKLNVNLMRMTTDNLFRNMTSVSVTSNTGATVNAQTLTISNHSTTNTTVINGGTAAVAQGVASAWTAGVTINVSDQTYASRAAETIRQSINVVSMQRADIGAKQNRLDHTINNLDATSENMKSANSRIADTDMAKEMTKFTQKNILSQAAQSMLAQANSQPQGILSLLN